MIAMGIGTGMLIAGLAGAGASVYGAVSSGRTQSKALKQSQENLERDRRERQAAWDAWQTSQEPVFQTRQDALMAQLGRYEGPVGGSWEPAAEPTSGVVDTMASLSGARLPDLRGDYRGGSQAAGQWSQGSQGKKKRKSKKRVGEPAIVESAVVQVPGSPLAGRMGNLYRG